MTLEELIQRAAQNADHFVEDLNAPFGVRSATTAGTCVLTKLQTTYEHYEWTTDEELLEAAAADIAEVALGLEAIAQSMLPVRSVRNAP